MAHEQCALTVRVGRIPLPPSSHETYQKQACTFEQATISLSIFINLDYFILLNFSKHRVPYLFCATFLRRSGFLSSAAISKHPMTTTSLQSNSYGNFRQRCQHSRSTRPVAIAIFSAVHESNPHATQVIENWVFRLQRRFQVLY